MRETTEAGPGLPDDFNATNLTHDAGEAQKTSTPNWDELIPNIFNDARFVKTSRRRRQIAVSGVRAGIVIAWRPDDYENFALNKMDGDRLLELRRDASFDAAFVVIATISNYEPVYVGHCEAEELLETLKSVRLRKGPHGEYWLLKDDFTPFDVPLSIPF